MELKYIHLSELFGEPISAQKVEELADRLLDDPRFAKIADAAQGKKNIEKRAETLSWLYLLDGSIPCGAQVYYEKSGKPQSDGVFFSVSHSDGLCAIAIADGPIGLDIERLREFPSRESFAERYFSENERAAARDLVGFFGVWTKKEACFKKTGEWVDTSAESIETSELDLCGERYIVSICSK